MRIQSLDFRQVNKVIELQKSRGHKEIPRICLLCDDAPEHMAHYKKQPLLFSESIYDSESKTVTIEKPMSDYDLERQNKNSSLLTTYCTMVGVPKYLILEVRL